MDMTMDMTMDGMTLEESMTWQNRIHVCLALNRLDKIFCVFSIHKYGSYSIIQVFIIFTELCEILKIDKKKSDVLKNINTLVNYPADHFWLPTHTQRGYHYTVHAKILECLDSGSTQVGRCIPCPSQRGSDRRCSTESK